MSDLNTDIDNLVDEFDFLGDWEERYRYLIEMGQALPGLDASERNDGRSAQRRPAKI